MVCTFGDLTDVIWWRELGLPVRAVLGPNGALRRSPWGETGWESRCRAGRGALRRAAGLAASKARAKIVELLAQPGDLVGEPRADHARREVLREGRAAARDRHQPPMVRPDDGAPRRADRARPRAALAPAVHARALRELGRRPERRLVREPPALLRRAVPRLVPARRADGAGLRQADRRARGAAAGRSVDRRARGLRRRSSAASRAASSAIPT